MPFYRDPNACKNVTGSVPFPDANLRKLKRMKCIRNLANTYCSTMTTKEMGKYLDAIRILIPGLLLIIIINFNFLISVVLFFKVLATTTIRIHGVMEGTQSPGRNGYFCLK
jgi:hypothetical protein